MYNVFGEVQTSCSCTLGGGHIALQFSDYIKVKIRRDGLVYRVLTVAQGALNHAENGGSGIIVKIIIVILFFFFCFQIFLIIGQNTLS